MRVGGFCFEIGGWVCASMKTRSRSSVEVISLQHSLWHVVFGYFCCLCEVHLWSEHLVVIGRVAILWFRKKIGCHNTFWRT